eukprot:TRINITY_DN56040_c0_g1_i1.p1 TRINITY_DN56040_c0_g1~~TRINITY_DN56040_c0_g1_i1.p1  ORF type:complete len:512 (-),score=69.62 TRINITY_DN56040_c0_g1_i1:593-2128(-)
MSTATTHHPTDGCRLLAAPHRTRVACHCAHQPLPPSALLSVPLFPVVRRIAPPPFSQLLSTPTMRAATHNASFVAPQLPSSVPRRAQALVYKRRRPYAPLPLPASRGYRVAPRLSVHNDEQQQSATQRLIHQSVEHVTSHPVDQHTASANGVSSTPASNSQSTSSARGSAVPISIGPFKVSVPPRWLLFTVPLMWGSFAPAVRLLYAQEPHQDPAIFNSERLLLSTIIYVPILVSEARAFLSRNNPSASAVASSTIARNRFSFFPAGIELGIYVFLANVAQVIGLQQTSASRAAFLVQLQTVIVPVMAGVFGNANIPLSTWLSSVVAVTGVALLSSDKGHGTVASLSGDALEVLSALFFSMYVFRLEKYCNSVAANPLVATKIAVQALLSIGWALFAQVGSNIVHAPSDAAPHVVSWTVSTVAINTLIVAWTGLVSSALSGWAQTKGQQGVPASEAVVIFATQPLWASALAAVLLGESFGARGLAGGALIIAATLIASGKGNPEKDGEKQS